MLGGPRIVSASSLGASNDCRMAGDNSRQIQSINVTGSFLYCIFIRNLRVLFADLCLRNGNCSPFLLMLINVGLCFG